MIRDGLTFDDVLLVPKHSTINSRSNVNLQVCLNKIDVYLNHPIIPANMATIMNYAMAEAIYLSGGLGLMHRFVSVEEQLNILVKLNEVYGRYVFKHIGLSVGIQEKDKEAIKYFIDNEVKIFCIDVAHLDCEAGIKMIKYFDKYPFVLLIAGNVATGDGARRAWEAGADFVKVGIGSSGICTTRIITGNGVPQLTALMDVAEVQQQLRELEKTKDRPKLRSFGIISDGGAKTSGDLVKSLCFADLVMSGNLFAGGVETPGDIINIDGLNYKKYTGSSTHKSAHIEGVEALVLCKGAFKENLSKLLEGIRSGCSYQNAHNLFELKHNPTFIRMSDAGLKESHIHDVIINKESL